MASSELLRSFAEIDQVDKGLLREAHGLDIDFNDDGGVTVQLQITINRTDHADSEE